MGMMATLKGMDNKGAARIKYSLTANGYPMVNTREEQRSNANSNKRLQRQQEQQQTATQTKREEAKTAPTEKCKEQNKQYKRRQKKDAKYRAKTPPTRNQTQPSTRSGHTRDRRHKRHNGSKHYLSRHPSRQTKNSSSTKKMATV